MSPPRLGSAYRRQSTFHFDAGGDKYVANSHGRIEASAKPRAHHRVHAFISHFRPCNFNRFRRAVRSRAVGGEENLAPIQFRRTDPIQRPTQPLDLTAKQQQAVELSRLGRYEHHRFPNHSTARCSAPSTPDGSNPNSRFALSCETNIFLRAMRTASSGTRGSEPVMFAHAVEANPAA